MAVIFDNCCNGKCHIQKHKKESQKNKNKTHTTNKWKRALKYADLGPVTEWAQEISWSL